MLLPVRHLRVLSIGEVLWDIFGENRHLGGAPFNFAYHCSAFRTYTEVVTRVGNDQAGQDIVERACELGVSPRLITVDSEHPTGTVTVTVDSVGVPSYIIHENVAWDYLELTHNAYELAPTADIVCFGTLAQRGEVSRDSILAARAAVRHGAMQVCDINLRQHYYDAQTIAASVRNVDVLKLNGDELPVLTRLLGLPGGDASCAARALMHGYGVRCVVQTLGARGARAWSAAGHVGTPGLGVKVADTVGSGDAFTAAFAVEVFGRVDSDTPGVLGRALELANAAGAYVATHSGATPAMNRSILAGFLHGCKGGRSADSEGRSPLADV